MKENKWFVLLHKSLGLGGEGGAAAGACRTCTQHVQPKQGMNHTNNKFCKSMKYKPQQPVPDAHLNACVREWTREENSQEAELRLHFMRACLLARHPTALGTMQLVSSAQAIVCWTPIRNYWDLSLNRSVLHSPIAYERTKCGIRIGWTHRATGTCCVSRGVSFVQMGNVCVHDAFAMPNGYCIWRWPMS
jgi:hypothetical protein|mmetsp:Transcript_18345/g.30418  ORF Transcript_18345/g.30418 Transcript_18345/m.30418 type:complete len:190 (+) Transcript_18345:1657-2226(+)